MKYYLAVDIGASSGRHILGHVENGRMYLEEMFRFENGYSEKNGKFYWDSEALFNNILEGMKACGKAGKIPVSMGIDTWGVDYVLLDDKDNMLDGPVSYRDSRTEGMKQAVDKIIPFSELYGITGIQYATFNTIYQLMAVKKQQPEILEKAKTLLFTPDYYHYLLTGEKRQEYTIASTSAMVNARSKEWDDSIIEKLNLPKKLFGKLSKPGENIGGLKKEIQEIVGFNCDVVLPASHDTGSAFLSVPAENNSSVYISSGTWSLLGIESMEPIITKEGMEANFSNEGGYDYRFRYLKNIMGLWMIQSIRRNLDKKYSFAQLEEQAKERGGFESVVDVNHESFLAPENMIDAIAAYCENTGQKVPGSIGETVQCVYNSLSSYYAASIKELEIISGRKFTDINIVGGGTKDGYLNALTAKASGLAVHTGPTEGTVVGNLIVQMIATGEFKNLGEARHSVRESFEIKDL